MTFLKSVAIPSTLEVHLSGGQHLGNPWNTLKGYTQLLHDILHCCPNSKTISEHLAPGVCSYKQDS